MKKDLTKYPLPLQVGEYGTKEEFEQYSEFSATDSGQWVHFEDRVKKVIEGKYDEIYPLLVEFLTTLLCNYRCPTCSRRKLREQWIEGADTWNDAPISHTTMMSLDDMRRSLEIFSEHNIPGIIWGGGDPTLNKETYKGMHYASELGLQSSFLTNGALLEEWSMEELLEIEPVLIRVSLNSGSLEIHRGFHGYASSKDYFSGVMSNLRYFAKRKMETKSKTLFGISVIVDERNLQDTRNIANFMKSIVEENGVGAIDYALFRSVYDYYDQFAVLDDSTYERAEKLIGEGSLFRQLFEEYGIKVVIPKTDAFKKEPDWGSDYSTECLSYGWCTELHPNGDIFLCSEKYGNPEYKVGNIFNEKLKDIWCGEQRKKVLDQINKQQCFLKACPHTGRGHHLNRLFQQIEIKRQAGKMDEVIRWINDLKEVTKPTLAYFL